MAKSFHIILLISVLFSSTGVVLGKHHCQRMEKIKANADIASCADLGGCKKGCCSTDAQYYHLDQDQEIPHFESDLPARPVIIALMNFDWQYKVGYNGMCELEFNSYRPPIVLKDISILYQVFRC